jgi:hypothetical protein
MKTRHITIKMIKNIAEKLNICIQIKDDKNHTRKYNNKKDLRILKLGLVNNHYFINEKLNITSYALKNYDVLYNKYVENDDMEQIKKFINIEMITPDGRIMKTKKKIYQQFQINNLFNEKPRNEKIEIWK